MCEFHGSNGNGFGDIWWTDNPIYFSSIDVSFDRKLHVNEQSTGLDIRLVDAVAQGASRFENLLPPPKTKLVR